MAAKRKTSRRKPQPKKRRFWPWLLFLLFALQAAWIAGYVYYTGAFLPWRAGVSPSTIQSEEWTQRKQKMLDELRVQNLLQESGSQSR